MSLTELGRESRRVIRFAVAVFVAMGCGPVPTTVPVRGSEVPVLLLAGKWVGTYDGTESGRVGVIALDLALGSRYAEGKVVMNADDPDRSATLPIKLVETAATGAIRGAVGPYDDPRLKVRVETEFTGTRRGDIIKGTFTTRPVGAPDKAQTGRWSVTKQR